MRQDKKVREFFSHNESSIWILISMIGGVDGLEVNARVLVLPGGTTNVVGSLERIENFW